MTLKRILIGIGIMALILFSGCNEKYTISHSQFSFENGCMAMIEIEYNVTIGLIENQTLEKELYNKYMECAKRGYNISYK